MNHDTRTCTHCNKEKPATLEFYYKHRHNADGLTSWCKDCMKALSNSRLYIPRSEKLPDLGEQKAVSWLRANGIPANGGKNIDAVKWLDVLAWGCVRIEVKHSKANKQGIWSWVMYSVNNKSQDEMPHVILFIGEDDKTGKSRYFVFDAHHPHMTNPKTGKRKNNVTYNYRAANAMNHEIFEAHENNLLLIETYRVSIAKSYISAA